MTSSKSSNFDGFSNIKLVNNLIFDNSNTRKNINYTNPFDYFDTKNIWYKHFGQEYEVCMFLLSDDKKNNNIIAPMKIKDNEISLLGSKSLFDYQDLLYSFDYDEKNLSNDIKKILYEIYNLKNIDNFMFESVSELSPLYSYFNENDDELWDYEVVFEDVCPKVSLPNSWESYLVNLKKKYRHELKRKIKRIHTSGTVNHYELSKKSEIMENLDYFIQLMKSSSVDKSKFMTQDNQAFFIDLIDNLKEKDNIVRLTFLEFDNTKVASSLSFVMNNTRYLYNSGYDPKFSDLSVGLINHAYAIKLSIKQNIKFFDFMRGNERYKYHLGSVDSKLYTINGKRK